MRDLPRLVADAAPDSKATLSVWRNGRTAPLAATLGELPENAKIAAVETGKEQEPAAEAAALGMHFEPLTDRMRRELHVAKDVHGVVVTRVDKGSAAENGGVSDGDVVVAVNQEPVDAPQQAAEKLTQATHSSKKSALLLLNRHGTTEYVGLNLDGNDRG
jgi:serine protease Do